MSEAPHPGEIMRFLLKGRRWTQQDLADVIGRPLSLVSGIARGRRRVTARTATELGAAFGNGPEFWLRLQNQYWLAGRGR